MACPYLWTTSPGSSVRSATLCPDGIGSRVNSGCSPPATGSPEALSCRAIASPAARSWRAIATGSSGCRRSSGPLSSSTLIYASRALLHPRMRGIHVRDHLASLSGQHPQVVERVPRGRDDGVKAAADGGDVVVAHQEGLLVPVLVVKDLDA